MCFKDDTSHPARGAWIEIGIALPSSNLITESHPARGAWIEIGTCGESEGNPMSHPARGAWIEIKCELNSYYNYTKSHPARGAWIEIPLLHFLHLAFFVASRKGCVD